MKKHTLQTLCTATLISLGLSFTAMGEERITDVSLIFSYDQSPEVQYQSARTEDEGSTLILHVRLPRIDGAIPAPLTADWSGHTAVWDEVDGADQYEIQLLKDRRTLTTLTSSAASCSFENWINNEGSYTFRVRAYNRKDRKNSGWCSDAEPLVITPEEAWFHSDGIWKEENGKHLFLYPNGAFPQMAWRQIDGKWYFFDGAGYMVSQCYVRSKSSDLYHWIGTDGVWDENGDTKQPNRAQYEVY